MKNRLLKVAKYLSSQGMYEEAAQIKKIAQSRDSTLGYELSRGQGGDQITDAELAMLPDPETRSKIERIRMEANIAGGKSAAGEDREEQWRDDADAAARLHEKRMANDPAYRAGYLAALERSSLGGAPTPPPRPNYYNYDNTGGWDSGYHPNIKPR